MNSIKRVYQSDRSTWVGDGFPTNSMLPMHEMGNQTSPFLVMGYTGAISILSKSIINVVLVYIRIVALKQ